MSQNNAEPAVLLNIAAWLTSTAEMDADCRGWYLNLLLHNYDKGSLPTGIEQLAVLAGVKHSEFERFTVVYYETLKNKFVLNEDTGRIENPKALIVMKGREQHKEQRTRSGTIGYIIKQAKTIKGSSKYIDHLKKYLQDLEDKQLEELKNIDAIAELLVILGQPAPATDETDLSFVDIDFMPAFKKWLDHKKGKRQSYKTEASLQQAYKKLVKDSGNDYKIAMLIIEHATGLNYDGFFPLKGTSAFTPAPAVSKVEQLTNQNERLKRTPTTTLGFDNPGQ